MGKKLSDIEGIASTYRKKLAAGGIGSIETLLERGSTARGRAEIAANCDISRKLILKWVNHADLFRVNGIAGQYAELLEASGVDTVGELSTRDAESLHQAMASINRRKCLCGRPPALKTVEAWISQAKTLPRAIAP